MQEVRSAFEPSFRRPRFLIAVVVVMSFFGILIARLYYLQILSGTAYLAKSESNFIQERRIPHARGLVYDQNHRILIDNAPSHDIYITMTFLPDPAKLLSKSLQPLMNEYETDDTETITWREQELLRHPIKDKGLKYITSLTNQMQLLVDAPLSGVVPWQDEPPIDAPIPLLVTVPDPPLPPLDEPRWMELPWRPTEGLFTEIQHAAEQAGAGGALRLFCPPTGEKHCALSVDVHRWPSPALVYRRVREKVGLSRATMNVAIQRAQSQSKGLGRFKPTLLIEDIGFEAYARIEAAAALGDVPGIDVFDAQKRRYRYGDLAAHALGFINEISEKELREDDKGYHVGDLIGRKGIERVYEDQLRGKDGIKRVVVDAKGRDKGEAWNAELLGDSQRDPPKPGNALTLSIDVNMQRAAEEAFKERAGSVVAIDPKTGFILAMASFPDYDPNLITGPYSGKIKVELDKNPDRPWTNKAIQDHYAPGSTFKAITAASGLINNLITINSSRGCPGYFSLGSTRWRCFNRTGHGSIALLRALQYSCDTYFYSLGYDLGPDRLAETARHFGFGRKTGIDLDREGPGIMPDRNYYIKRFGAYSPGYVINNSIGQGDVAATPLQLAVAYASIVNGGKVYQPQLVREIHDADGKLIQQNEPNLLDHIDISPEELDILRESLAHVTDPGGTASSLLRRSDMPDLSQWLRESGVVIGGKTGTAQVVRLSKSVAHVDVKDVEYEQRDHAWFVGFAPADKPEIVVVTMTVHGGFGGQTSAPVTAMVMKAWFDNVRGQGRYDDYGKWTEQHPPKIKALSDEQKNKKNKSEKKKKEEKPQNVGEN